MTHWLYCPRNRCQRDLDSLVIPPEVSMLSFFCCNCYLCRPFPVMTGITCEVEWWTLNKSKHACCNYGVTVGRVWSPETIISLSGWIISIIFAYFIGSWMITFLHTVGFFVVVYKLHINKFFLSQILYMYTWNTWHENQSLPMLSIDWLGFNLCLTIRF